MESSDLDLRLPGKRSPVPLYYQLAELIESHIDSGVLNPGDKLPPERDIATMAGISRMTARQALGYLEQRGAIEVRHGVGTFVTPPKLTSDPLHLLGFTEQMMATGGRVTSSVLEQDVIEAPKSVANALGIHPGERVAHIMRLRSLNGEPMLLETSHFRHAHCAGIENHDLSERSLYATLAEEFGIHLTHAQQTIEAIAANSFESELFGIEKGLPMLLVEGVAWTADGVAGEFFKAVYRGDRFKFALRPTVHGAGSPEAALPINLVLT